MRANVAVALVLVALLAFGCASDVVRPDVVYVGTRASYDRVLKNWTREGKLYREFDTRLMVWATLLSEDFIKAYLSEEARTREWDQAKFLRKLSEYKRRYKNVIPFQLVVLTHEKEWDDFYKPRSSWDVFLLTDDGRRVDPIAIRQASLEPESSKIMFPFLSDWSSVYVVTFPAISPEGDRYWDENTKSLKLVIAGPSGRIELVWKFGK